MYRLPTIAALCLCLLLATGLFGCGYQFAGDAPNVFDNPAANESLDGREVRTLFIGTVKNPTLDAALPAAVRAQMRDEINRRGFVGWAPREEADAIMDVDIERFTISSSVIDEEDETLQFSASVQLKADVRRRSDGKQIWDSGWVSGGEAFFSGNEDTARRRALQLAILRLVDLMEQAY